MLNIQMLERSKWNLWLYYININIILICLCVSNWLCVTSFKETDMLFVYNIMKCCFCLYRTILTFLLPMRSWDPSYCPWNQKLWRVMNIGDWFWDWGQELHMNWSQSRVSLLWTGPVNQILWRMVLLLPKKICPFQPDWLRYVLHACIFRPPYKNGEFKTRVCLFSTSSV